MEPTSLEIFKQTIQFVEKGNIAIKPFCLFFGLNYSNQIEKIKRDPILKQLYGNFRTTGADNKQYLMFCLTKRGFLRWIDRINPQNVESVLQEKFISFQLLIDEYLYGNIERDEQMRLNYIRLKKLKRLYGIIGREIQKADTEIKEYLDCRYIQASLPFTKQNSITN